MFSFVTFSSTFQQPTQSSRYPLTSHFNPTQKPSTEFNFNSPPQQTSVIPTKNPNFMILRPTPSHTECGVVRNIDNPSEFPWQVSIFTQNGNLICGGTIIGPSHVLTGR